MSEWFIVSFSAVVAISTAVYAFLTYRLVAETRRLREIQTEPVISVRAEFSPRAESGGLELVIRNEGQGGARNINFRFDGDPTYFVESGIDTPINEMPVLRDGLQYLGPNQRFDVLMGWLRGDSYQRAIEKPWIFHVTYENDMRKCRKSTYVVDFAQFDKIILRDSSPLFKIEEHLAEMKSHLGEIKNKENLG